MNLLSLALAIASLVPATRGAVAEVPSICARVPGSKHSLAERTESQRQVGAAGNLTVVLVASFPAASTLSCLTANGTIVANQPILCTYFTAVPYNGPFPGRSLLHEGAEEGSDIVKRIGDYYNLGTSGAWCTAIVLSDQPLSCNQINIRFGSIFEIVSRM